MDGIVRQQITDDEKAPSLRLAASLGAMVVAAERRVISLATSRVCRFRTHHAVLYGLAAFVMGGGLVSIFIMTTYSAYESIDLGTAFYQVLLGGLGGGIVSVVLAFAYAATIRPTLEPMRAGGIIGDAEATHPMR